MYLGGVEDWYLKLEYSQALTPRKYTKVPFSEYTNSTENGRLVHEVMFVVSCVTNVDNIHQQENFEIKRSSDSVSTPENHSLSYFYNNH